jgi:hypothetical protein
MEWGEYFAVSSAGRRAKWSQGQTGRVTLRNGADDSHGLGHRDHHRQRIYRRGNKTVPLIEPPCLFRNSMDQDCADACNIRSVDYAHDRIAKEPSANALAMEGSINGEASEDDRRNGVRHVTSDSSGRIDVGDGTRRKCVIAYNLSTGADQVRPRGSALFIPLRPTAEPVIQDRLAGIERGEIVPGGKFLGRAYPRRTAHLTGPRELSFAATAAARGCLLQGCRVCS